MPTYVSLNARPTVTAGFANDIEAVNQYSALMYAATASGVIAGRVRPTQIAMPSRPNVATGSLFSLGDVLRLYSISKADEGAIHLETSRIWYTPDRQKDTSTGTNVPRL
ncbi:hypothetical protein BH11MYX1_BH11MYX1_37230 [soil metagenome]